MAPAGHAVADDQREEVGADDAEHAADGGTRSGASGSSPAAATRKCNDGATNEQASYGVIVRRKVKGADKEANEPDNNNKKKANKDYVHNVIPPSGKAPLTRILPPRRSYKGAKEDRIPCAGVLITEPYEIWKCAPLRLITRSYNSTEAVYTRLEKAARLGRYPWLLAFARRDCSYMSGEELAPRGTRATGPGRDARLSRTYIPS